MYVIPTLQKLLVDPELTNMRKAKSQLWKNVPMYGQFFHMDLVIWIHLMPDDDFHTL